MSHLELSDSSTVLAKIAQKFPSCLGVLRITQLSEFVVQVLFFLLQIHASLVIVAVFRATDDFGNDGFNLRLDATGENAVQRIIIPSGDGVEFVIMTPGAGDGQA